VCVTVKSSSKQLNGWFFSSLLRDASSGPTDLTVVGNTLFFSASNGTNRGLWKSDGTSSGTVLLKDNIEPGAYALPIYGYYGYYYSYYDYSSRGSFMTAAGNTLFFTARDETYETELWKSDGTSAGTVVVKDILPGAGSSYPGYLTAIGNTLYFSAYDGLERELWRSDGTANGTFLVKDINSGSGSSSPGELKAIGNTLYFRAFDDTNGTELWSSDGTSAGTRLIRDISPGENSSWPTYLTAVGASLFFTAYDGSHGEELWRSDGTLAGTAVVNILPGGNSSIPADLTAVHDILFFTAYDGTHGEELWISDGTASGTFLVRDINPGSTDSTPKPSNSPLYRDPIHRPIAVGNTFYFVANDGTHGFELWKSDGSSTGTSLVKDINPGIGSSSPRHLTAIGNTLYFVAYNTATGIELWKSDGSSAGTVLVQDIRPGASSSSPNELRSLGNTLLFTANDGTNGAELWGLTTEGALSNTPPSFTAIPDIEVIENATDTTIDLWPLFHDAEDPDSLLIYSVTSNSNSSLISADISATSGQLTLSFTPDQTGIAQITIEATDTDGASVSTDVTVLVTSFDANNDGIADSTQPTVISVATPNQQLATFVADSSISLPTIETVDSPDPDLAPAGLEFSQGFYDIRFDGLTPGDSTTLILYLPEASTINSYWKYGPLTPGGPSEWYDFGFDPVTQTGAEFQDLNGDGQNEILLHFVDGLRGDADLITNGTIVDPGGPAMDPTQEENQNNGEAIFSITTDGAPEVGETLTASLESSDPDGDGAFSYQWQSSSDGTAWSDIAGATAQTYALTVG
jgi:ELWxxDGT repeat protein